MRAHALGGRLHRSRHNGVVVVWRLGLGAPVSPASDTGGRDQEPKDADSLEYSDQQTRFGIPIIETSIFPSIPVSSSMNTVFCNKCPFLIWKDKQAEQVLTKHEHERGLLMVLRRMLLGARSMSLPMKTRMLTGCSLAVFLRIQQVFPKLCHKDEIVRMLKKFYVIAVVYVN